jgi:hypothetical protein
MLEPTSTDSTGMCAVLLESAGMLQQRQYLVLLLLSCTTARCWLHWPSSCWTGSGKMQTSRCASVCVSVLAGVFVDATVCC